MEFGISILGSGSRGNALLLHNNKSGILIDAGFSCREIMSRLDKLEIDPGIIQALLVSHEHSDHVRGCRVFSDKLNIPTYTTGPTGEFLVKKNQLGRQRVIFEPGSQFDIDIFHIEPFSVQHDAIDPVGFTVSAHNIKVGVATDLGHLNSLNRQRLLDCDALVLESNHDRQMLWDTPRPLALKRRILSRHGHLDNENALAALEILLTSRTRFLFLAHVSEEANCPDLVENLAVEKLTELGRPDILLNVLEQNRPLPTVWLH